MLARFRRRKLFLYPELYLSALGPMSTPAPEDYAAAVAEPVPGPLTDRLCKVAAELDRKCFPWRPWERTTAGSEFVVFDIEDVGRAGLMICYDGWFPEVPRHLAWMGAEVIFQPSATGTSDREQELVLARANAIVNQVFVVNVNMGGRPGPGRTIIVDPEGHPLQVAGDGEEYLTEVIDLDHVTRVRELGSVGLNRLWAQLDSEGPSLNLTARRSQ